MTTPRSVICAIAVACAALAGCKVAAPAAPRTPEAARTATLDAADVPADTQVREQALVYDEIDWNGEKVIFVSYMVDVQDPADPGATVANAFVSGLRVRANGGRERFAVMKVESEGGDPHIENITRVNADADPAKELAIIVSWEQRHLDVNGKLYAVYIYDDLAAARGRALTALETVRKQLPEGCECTRSDGPDTTAPLKTGDEVKAALARLGFVQ